jgi:3-hydroxyacyl-[acyl-carrier-protein] dehydratase
LRELSSPPDSPSAPVPRPADVIPHRAPFLLVDEVLELVPGERAVGRWTIDPAADFLRGHFPGNPVVPGVLIVEALAQVGGIAGLSHEDARGKVPLFAGIERARFRRIVRPGDVLTLETRITRWRRTIGEAEGVATVGGERACEATIRFAAVDAAAALPGGAA